MSEYETIREITDSVDQLVRRGASHSAPPASAAFADGVMDNGTVQHPLLQYPVNIFSPDECLRAAQNLIQGHRASGAPVTHTLVWPGEVADVSLQQSEDCVALYTLLGQKNAVEAGLLEHSVSYISRLSVVVHLTPVSEVVLDYADIVTLARAIHGSLFEETCGRLVQSEGPRRVQDPVCMLLRQRGTHSFQMHWPNVSLLQHDLASVAEGLGGVVTDCSAVAGGRITSMTLRGSQGQTPVYGSTEHQGEEPFLFWCWLYENMVYPLHLNLGPQHGHYIVTAENVHLALPFLYSLNPVASCVELWRWRDTHSDAAAWELLGLPNPNSPLPASPFYATDDNAWDRQVDAVRRLLCIIDGRVIARQMQTGLNVHGALHGGWIGFCLWVNWIDQSMRSNGGEPGPWYEYYRQWQRFGWGTQDASPLRMLHSFAQSDSPERFRLFLATERRMDHPNRDILGGEESLIQLFGSIHHLDIARFLRHEVHDEMVCVSTSRPSQWYAYERNDHRWHYDGDGPSCTLRCYKLIARYVNQAREAVDSDGGGPGPAPAGGAGRGAPLSVMVNFPDEFNRREICKQTLVHLERNIGDIRHMSCVMRAMQLFLHNPRFLSGLDTRNDHVVPFANGVLDLSLGYLRPGIPQDMVSKGPTYAWQDHSADDVVEVERLLTTVFPDTTLRDFFLQVAASLLRKRNRYKHFYVLSGNTNGGKSFLMSILKQAFGSLFTQLPVSAITCRESDPSNHSDYLYRTAGCNLAAMHEPDSATQRILPDRIKGLTSDSDEVSCRPIFGQAVTISIPWKLFLLCNTIPPLANVDAATVERIQIIPFLSTFNSTGVPSTETDQFAARLFTANRTYNIDKVEELGRRLMAVLWATYQRHAMHSASYTLQVPQQIRLGVERYMRDLSLFRVWCSAFVRPTTPLCKRNTFVPRCVDHDLQALATNVLRYIRRLAHNNSVQPWDELDEAVRQDSSVPGSQGWVHAQCCNMWDTILTHMLWGQGLSNSGLCTLGIAAVDLTTIVETFNSYRSRNRQGSDLCNSKNSADPGERADRRSGGNHQRNLRTSLPMDLDIGLVSQVVREVVGRDAYDSLQLGVVIITDQPQTAFTETDQVSSLTVEDALLSCATQWETLYGIPMPHVGLVDTHALRSAAQQVRVCAHHRQRTGVTDLEQHIVALIDQQRLWVGKPARKNSAEKSPLSSHPVMSENPTCWDHACQLIQTASLYAATTLSDLEQQSRITRFESGFTKVGTFPAVMPEQEKSDPPLPRTFVGSFYDRARGPTTGVVERSPDQLCRNLHTATTTL